MASDADHQMDSRGGATGKDPDEEGGGASDEVTGDADMVKRTGESQATEDHENDPPA